VATGVTAGAGMTGVVIAVIAAGVVTTGVAMIAEVRPVAVTIAVVPVVAIAVAVVPVVAIAEVAEPEDDDKLKRVLSFRFRVSGSYYAAT
jgi:nitrate/nitrite transporter NarK